MCSSPPYLAAAARVHTYIFGPFQYSRSRVSPAAVGKSFKTQWSHSWLTSSTGLGGKGITPHARRAISNPPSTRVHTYILYIIHNIHIIFIIIIIIIIYIYIYIYINNISSINLISSSIMNIHTYYT